jgi:zinc/manganese transport system permease protein
VDEATLQALVGLAALCLAGLAVIARPLLFASLQPELAEARGVPVRLISVVFLAIVGLATAGCTQVVGVLLVFTLMVGPAAAAQQVTMHFGRSVALAAGLAVAETWLGITLAFYTDWPSSFWITAVSTGVYAAASLIRRR